MIWLFALGIIWTCLVHKGFRNIVLLLLGVASAVVLAALAVGLS